MAHGAPLPFGQLAPVARNDGIEFLLMSAKFLNGNADELVHRELGDSRMSLTIRGEHLTHPLPLIRKHPNGESHVLGRRIMLMHHHTAYLAVLAPSHSMHHPVRNHRARVGDLWLDVGVVIRPSDVFTNARSRRRTRTPTW